MNPTIALPGVRVRTGASLPTSSFELLLSAAKNTLLSTFLGAMPEGLILLDANGRVVYMNDRGAQILALDARDVQGRRVDEIVDFEPVVLSALTSGVGYVDRPFTIRSRSLGTLELVKSAIVVHDDAGAMIGIVDYFRTADGTCSDPELPPELCARYQFSSITGSDPALMTAIDRARRAAVVDSTVLLTGESGTGKELFAHAIHEASRNRRGPFVAVNCAGLPAGLVESELFGYEKGAFTGAERGGARGKFEQAQNGTIFLDEIAELPLDMQAKLLRVLQERRFTRVGGSRVVQTNARVVAATNRDLGSLVRKGEFRNDLFYRLDVLRVEIPPLRERLGDIEPLVAALSEAICDRHSLSRPEFSRSAIDILSRHDWPGNVRELKNLLERLMVLRPAQRYGADDIRAEFPTIGTGPAADLPLPIRAAIASAPPRGALDDAEQRVIERAVADSAGNMSEAARVLGISRTTLYRKLRQFAEAG